MRARHPARPGPRLPDDDVRAAFYTALLQHVGCTGYAHETARVFGDELVFNVAAGRQDAARRLGLPEAELAALRAQPSWPARVAAAPTITRELRAVPEAAFDRGQDLRADPFC
ncbi:MAG TPA: hypothetical protein VFN05_18335 [Actinomycetes bacterium]|nr:hypothetical protein [Actinomycetes bacterium]